jgi:hypothetical protein
MSNDIDLYNGGDIQPYNPGQPLAPLQPDTWGATDVDLLREDHHQHQSGPTLFGAALPPSATPQQVAQTLNEIQAVIVGDLMRLGHPQSSINAAVNWFQNNARKTPVRETKRHSYNLHDQAGDLVAESFGNAMAKAGATQEFISNCLWLLGELNKRLGASQGKPAHGRAPQTTDPLDSLNDQQYEWVIKANQAAALQTEITLRRKWGDSSYVQNIQVAQEYLENLPPNEQRHFNQYTTGWIHSLNTVEVLEFLFNNAIGAGNIPTSGGAVQAEINQIEGLMRTHRAAYNKDSQIQARLRTLYSIRDKR